MVIVLASIDLEARQLAAIIPLIKLEILRPSPGGVAVSR